MRVIFMGTPHFAVVSLQKLLKEKIKVVAVVTTPDKPKGRGLKLQPSPVKNEAENHNIPVLQPDTLKSSEFKDQLERFKPDLIVVVAYKILPEAVFSIPPMGTINLHGSLLPKYRGAAPINWAIINGETETGVTTIFINKKVDTGNIIESQEITISENMTAGELHDKMANMGANLLYKSCIDIKDGKVNVKIQDEKFASLAPKIFKEMCKVDFDQSARKVHNFIRGLSPYPAAFSSLNGKKVKLFGSKVHEENNDNKKPKGSIIDIINDKIIIQCLNSSISINEIQIEGKRKMKIDSFLRGNQIEVNQQLGE